MIDFIKRQIHQIHSVGPQVLLSKVNYLAYQFL